MKAMEIFETVKTHLLEQNQKAYNDRDELNCKYKSSNGLKCAIGCLIPDSVYTPIMEGEQVTSLMGRMPELKLYLCAEDLPEYAGILLLQKLQIVHDQKKVSEWPDELEIIRGVTLNMLV